MPKPAVFLDRDGVMNVNRPDDVKSWAEFEWIPGSLEAIAQITAMGYPIFVITNQRAIGNGSLTVGELENIHQHIREDAVTLGGKITAFYYCPCAEVKKRCPCEKPKPYMLKKAAREYDVDLTQSWLIGDKATDIMSGVRAGCKTILVLTGEGNGARGMGNLGKIIPNSIQPDLKDAIQWLAHLITQPT
jgi:D-glycero-D-manno-heptose 1,7-bisphosphate phosphatase